MGGELVRSEVIGGVGGCGEGVVGMVVFVDLKLIFWWSFQFWKKTINLMKDLKFQQNFHIWEKIFNLMKDPKYEHQSTFPLGRESQT